MVWLAMAAWAEPEGDTTRGLEGGAFEQPAEGLGAFRYRAILFGAQEYPDGSGFPALSTPRRDVEQLAAVLQDQYGFEVDLVLDPTRADIIDHLSVLADARPTDAFVVYYAGHGMRSAEQDRTWWIPVDAASGSSANWVSNDDVSGPMRASPAQHILLVSDSCFSGGLLRGVAEEVGHPQTEREASTLSSRVSRWVVTSGGDEPVSDSGSDGMSVFAFHLARTLRDARRPYVTVDGLFPELRQAVIRDSEQMPESGAMGKGFHQGGQLVLWNRDADPTAVVADAGDREGCTLSGLLEAVELTEVAYRAVHDVRGARPAALTDPVLTPFVTAHDEVHARLRCVSEPLEPSTVAAIHRLRVLEAVLTGSDDVGVRATRAMLGADPDAGWSPLLGVEPAEWGGWLTRAETEEGGPTRRLRQPLGGWLLVDGAKVGSWQRTAPTDRPYVFQYQRDSEEVAKSMYVDVGEPIPAYPTPGKAQFRSIGVTLLLVGATGALTSLPLPKEVLGTFGTTSTTTTGGDDVLARLYNRNKVGFIVGTTATGAGLGFLIVAASAR